MLAVSAQTHVCVDNSEAETCATFRLEREKAEEDATMLCERMPMMPACGVFKVCKARNTELSPPVKEKYCDPWVILHHVCSIDEVSEGKTMSGMAGCNRHFNKICKVGTSVKTCKMNSPLKYLPTTWQVTDALRGICQSHPMKGCETCDSNFNCGTDFDNWGTLSKLCQAMPTMQGCSEWRGLCDSGLHEMGAFCRENSEMLMPMMRMYFHTGISDIVLFYHWVPRTTGQYIATVFAILVMGIAWNGLKLVRQLRDKKLAAHMYALKEERHKRLAKKSGLDRSCCNVISHNRPIEKSQSSEESFCNNDVEVNVSMSKEISARPPSLIVFGLLLLERGVLAGFDLFVAYLLMLIAMTFNVGLFISVLVGHSLGVMIFTVFPTFYDPLPDSPDALQLATFEESCCHG